MPGEPARGLCQSLLVFAEEAGVRDKLAVRQGGECFKPHVNTNSSRQRQQGLGVHFGVKTNIPFVVGPMYGAGFDLTLNGAMNPGFDLRPSTEHEQVNALLADSEARLWIGKAVVLPAAFEPWEAEFLTCADPAEEILVGRRDSFGDIL